VLIQEIDFAVLKSLFKNHIVFVRYGFFVFSRTRYCNVRDGKWLTYNENGQIIYIEIWDEGEFIEQRPKSEKVQIWKVELSLDGVEVDTQRIVVEDFYKLKIIAKYKNSNESNKLKV